MRRHYVVVVGFGDLGAVEAAGLRGSSQLAEVVDVDFAVDLRGVELGAAFPEQRRLFAFAFGEHDQLAAHPLLLGALADGLLQLHQAALAGFDGALGNFAVERKCARAFFVGVAEDAQPVELRLADELLQKFKVAERFAGEADDEAGAQGDAGNGGADFFQSLEKDLGAAAALHALENCGRGVLQRQVEIFADVVVLGDGFEQAAGDAVGIGVEEAEPAQACRCGRARRGAWRGRL